MEDSAKTPIWRQGVKAVAAIAVTAALFFLAAFLSDPSAMRERLGFTPPLDVPYVATRRAMVMTMLDMAGVGPADHVIDLGTGDGRILIAAAQDRGASGLGVDLDPALIEDARDRAASLGLADRISFREQDLFDTPLHDADVVTMFLLPEINLRLRPRLLAELRPGSRVVSHRFGMGDWRPDEIRRSGGYPAYLWIVPARIAGSWRLQIGERSIPVEFEQSFQRVTGTAMIDGQPHPFTAALRGDSLRFSLDPGTGSQTFAAVVRDGRLEPADGGDWSGLRLRD